MSLIMNASRQLARKFSYYQIIYFFPFIIAIVMQVHSETFDAATAGDVMDRKCRHELDVLTSCYLILLHFTSYYTPQAHLV